MKNRMGEFLNGDREGNNENKRIEALHKIGDFLSTYKTGEERNSDYDELLFIQRKIENYEKLNENDKSVIDGILDDPNHIDAIIKSLK